MHWLSIFFHYVVGDIYQVIDRADTIGSQASLHPFRGRSDLDIFDNSCCISRAKLRIFYGNFHIVRCFFVISCFFYYRSYKFLIKSCCCFSGNAKYTITVYTIGCDLVFKNNIIQSQCFNCAFSYNCIFRENVDAVFRCFRIHFSCTSQFFDGAHHTTGFHTAEFAFFDFDAAWGLLSVMSAGYTSAIQNYRNFIPFFYIRSTGNDLHSFAAYIYLADDQFVCIRVFFYFFNLTDNNIFKVSIQFFKAFYFCS